MNARCRTVLAALALGVPALLGARSVALDQAPANDARAGALAANHDTTAPIAAHMSGTAVDLWYLWALRHELVPAAVRVAAVDDSTNKLQQESQP